MGDAVDVIRVAWAQRRPDLDTEPIAVVGRIMRAARYLEAAADERLAAVGITRTEFDVLSQLRRSPVPLRPGDLTAGVVGSPAATTKRLHKLVGVGLVTRSTDPEDARAARVGLTPAGEALVDAVLPEQLAAEAELLSIFTPEQRGALADLLRTALAAWES
ncbi:MarR family winged helix-turn-helix transcriptional regulator [Pseudonocardia oroxyli]|uniref:DNA-binding transcriptional regulator, MarR family n=1 Tax=Pseudonocardia oroxyli TaxID=366584 RepID=A0A1G7M333_PSEOR|nr:MarR family transcriptional regulator [Pseudonocardia oroxyli]SDF56212.1 DNA-binding transcriptional regulator, MarR family [Pseudonocardia oroxyli]